MSAPGTEDALGRGGRHNIVGVVVRCRPEAARDMHRRLAALPGTEVHAATEDGRFVVTVEGADRECGDRLLAVHRLEGVLAASLVTHHFEPDSESIEDLETGHAANQA